MHLEPLRLKIFIQNALKTSNVLTSVLNYLKSLPTSTAKPDHTHSHMCRQQPLALHRGPLLSPSSPACSCWPACQFPGIKPSEMTRPHATKWLSPVLHRSAAGAPSSTQWWKLNATKSVCSVTVKCVLNYKTTKKIETKIKSCCSIMLVVPM